MIDKGSSCKSTKTLNFIPFTSMIDKGSSCKSTKTLNFIPFTFL